MSEPDEEAIFLVTLKDLENVTTGLKALEEFYNDYCGQNIFSNNSVRGYVLNSFSIDPRELKAIFALAKITPRGAGDFYSFIMSDDPSPSIQAMLLSEGIHWNMVASRIKVSISYLQLLNCTKFNHLQNVLETATSFGTQPGRNPPIILCLDLS